MVKKIIGKDVYYHLAWSPVHKYDRYNASRVLPELSGIISLFYIGKKGPEHLLIYGCWRDGCRVAMKKLLTLDPFTQRLPEITRTIDTERLYYRYTIVDTNPKDMQDILFWLIKTYTPEYNNAEAFEDSQRYENIAVKESDMRADQAVERFSGR